MKGMRNARNFPRWLFAVAGAAAMLVALGGVLWAAGPDIQAVAGLRAVGVARASVQTDKLVAQVGQQTITLADYQEGKADVNANLAYMRGQIARGGPLAADLQARVKLIEESGVETVALASSISKAALYQKALDGGYGATDQEVQAAVAKQREINSRPGFNQLQGYIGAVGEQRFWSEVMPVWQRRQIAIGKMYRAVTKDVDPKHQKQAWTEFERNAVGNTPVRMVDPGAVAPATQKSALDYLARYWQLAQ